MKAHSRKIFLLLVALLLAMGTGIAQQSRKELEDKRKRLLKDIEQTSSLLKQTKQDKAATLSRYVTLQKQISKRQQLVETLQKEMQFLLENVDRTATVVLALNDDTERLKAEYIKIARHAYRQRLMHSDWLFLLSAKSFNDAFRRWQYLRQYDRYRQRQGRLILDTQQTLLDKIKNLEDRKREKENLLGAEKRQSLMLGLEMQAKNRLLDDLKGDEARLAHDLEGKQAAASKLNKAIEKVIRDEMERIRREERSAAAAASATTPGKTASPRPTPEVSNLSNDFNKNQGNLPWPVRNGIITGHFGRQQHPTIANIEIVNNGIDIQTDQGAQVRSVFEGTVVGTQFIPGFDYMVILQHGSYYTVYSNLEEVSVKKGDKLMIGQSLGKVSTDQKTDTSAVHFEIWKEKTRLNPQDWVRK
ncbi:MAG: peptidoglycan DD-metalloendopeptidase family protein [Saprospiraceae bacterium]|nr:peptidoglycan DD-metalloendopeptidase family protein [Saprospiraceae bacterium]MCF8251244.1 peptidoglycan DD-metalloendopeptidase family protein [Saprospiraceae bacterium]MCF8282989.1 peptidoglycan DD-metalloendopeptidase family protein [Bacteroidales bacterium]MCF8313132.1 peptidoglycan DD-metalloendopeptidase family protein [Saprospiraceae bacterium]MCF8441606.1 peptidoglycan DD-metalloendopeptidase family protein [Saprospiraceae bacterium]